MRQGGPHDDDDQRRLPLSSSQSYLMANQYRYRLDIHFHWPNGGLFLFFALSTLENIIIVMCNERYIYYMAPKYYRERATIYTD